jgi:hypothetical protein
MPGYNNPGGADGTNPGSVYGTPPARAPGSQILQDSNPIKYPQPKGGIGQARPSGGERPLLGGQTIMAGGGGPATTNSGSILGSSVGNPGFYGAGLAPASGLGGGLYPSLVSLYR